MPLAGSIGFGLVWGWLLAGFGGARAPWRTGFVLALAALISLIAAGLAWMFAGLPALVAMAVSAVLAGLLRVAWHREIGVPV
jgi:hypothetical protein